MRRAGVSDDSRPYPYGVSHTPPEPTERLCSIKLDGCFVTI